MSPRDETPGDAERRRAAEALETQLERRGIRLTGRETGEELLMLLDAVERFEDAVGRRGGDLMMDQPTDDGGSTPLEPDDRAFVLPERTGGMSVDAFLDAIARATQRARTRPT